MEGKRTPGLVFGVTNAERELCWAYAGTGVLGDASSGAVTPDSVFWICSQGKLILSVRIHTFLIYHPKVNAFSSFQKDRNFPTHRNGKAPPRYSRREHRSRACESCCFGSGPLGDGDWSTGLSTGRASDEDQTFAKSLQWLGIPSRRRPYCAVCDQL